MAKKEVTRETKITSNHCPLTISSLSDWKGGSSYVIFLVSLSQISRNLKENLYCVGLPIRNWCAQPAMEGAYNHQKRGPDRRGLGGFTKLEALKQRRMETVNHKMRVFNQEKVWICSTRNERENSTYVEWEQKDQAIVMIKQKLWWHSITKRVTHAT